VLPVCETAELAVLINALSLRSDADRGTAHPDTLQQADLTRFAEPMEQGVCRSSYVLDRFKAPDTLIASLFEPE
jgi:hypothetical protein